MTRCRKKKNGQTFSTNDKVYYLRDKTWRGPGKVIGQDSAVVFIRHGGAIVRAHSCKVQLVLPSKICEKTSETFLNITWSLLISNSPKSQHEGFV